MNKEKTIKKNHQFRWIIKKGKKVNKKTVRVFITNNKEKKNKNSELFFYLFDYIFYEFY